MISPIVGKVWKFGDSVNTDEMYPGFALSMTIEEASQHAFEASRPGWSKLVEPGDVIVGGRDFGAGSSRPVPLLFRALGISAIVADSFTSLFFRNCINYGLAAMPVKGVSVEFEEGETIAIDVHSGAVTNSATGTLIYGDPYPQTLAAIVEAGGVIEQLRRDGYLSPLEGEGAPQS